MHVRRLAVAPARVDSPRSGIDSFDQIPRNSEYRSAWRRLARIRGDHRRPAVTSLDALPDEEDSAGRITASQTEGKEGRSC